MSPLLDDDDALEAIWKKEYSLAALVAPDQFKSYDDLKKPYGLCPGNQEAFSLLRKKLSMTTTTVEEKKVSEGRSSEET